MKKLLLFLLVAVAILIGALAANTASFTSMQDYGAEPAAALDLNVDSLAAHFSRGLTYQTVSYQLEADRDSAAFLAFHDFLSETYPATHAALTREVVADLSLLYTWEGTEPGLTPVVLMGHMDVVPVIPGTEEDWDHPPFAGEIADGYIWGRGALDDKSTVMALMESVELLVAAEHRPRRTIYIALGHDEEVGGDYGAQGIANLLESRGIAEYALVLDEGGAIAPGEMMGLPGKTMAIIGIAEKGFVSLELRVEAAGGHSSMPPAQTAIGILAKAISRLEENPFPASLDGPAMELFRYMGPEMGTSAKVAFANLWLTRPLVERQLLSSPQTAAMLRTTTAATIFNAGVKDNVLPIDAYAVVNHRIRPGETVESVAEYVRQVINDPRVQVIIPPDPQNPSKVSDPEGPAFKLLSRTIRETVPADDLIIAPYLVMGGTDAKYYSQRSENVFRFLAVVMEDGDMDKVHGTNERIRVESLAGSVQFFHQLILNTDDL